MQQLVKISKGEFDVSRCVKMLYLLWLIKKNNGSIKKIYSLYRFWFGKVFGMLVKNEIKSLFCEKNCILKYKKCLFNIKKCEYKNCFLN